MGLAHSPKVVTDNLVFYYDMGNTQKSWRGAPTTNLAAANFFSGNNNFSTNQNVTDVMPDGSIGIARDLDAQTIVDPNRTVSIGSYSLTPGVTYTLSFYAKNINCTGFNGNLYSPTLLRVIGAITYPTLNTTSWTRVVTTFTVPDEGPNPVVLSPQVFRDGGIGKFRLCWLMLEQSSLASSYTSSSRSNTQAILDLTNNNTVTATSLTYNSDGTFSFNGSSNYITLNSILSAKPFTISFWTKLNSIKNQGFYSSRTVLGSGISIFGLAAGGIRFDTGDNQWTPAYTLETNKWINIVVSIDVANKYLYINGVFHSSTSYASTINNISSSIATLGASQVEGTEYANYVDGDISGYIIYNRALSAAEIAQNFQALRGRYGI